MSTSAENIQRAYYEHSLKSIVLEVHPHPMAPLDDDASAVADILWENGFQLFTVAPRLDSSGNPVLEFLAGTPIDCVHYVYARRGGPAL
jgi:hypothetical protein